jgi:hypothetical protein
MKPAAVSEVRSIAADSERTSAAKADMPETEVRVKQCAGVLVCSVRAAAVLGCSAKGCVFALRLRTADCVQGDPLTEAGEQHARC